MMPPLSIPRHPCARPEIEHVSKFVAYTKKSLNAAQIYPPARNPKYIVALALYSKAITVAEATIVLLDAGFSDEAFGMTRTLVDIFFSLHYIANKDTDERARRYVQFIAKDKAVWSELGSVYWPEGQFQPLDERTKKIAATYPSPHQWSGKSVKDMALEPDTVELDPATGAPAVHDVAYRIVYRMTSHYVHPTASALGNHLVEVGSKPFVVRSGDGNDMRHVAVFNTACYLVNTMISFFRCMGEPQPHRLSRWAEALIKHVARRHS
jgi:hypothetical protein